MSSDSDSKLGHDPLEWLQDDEEELEDELGEVAEERSAAEGNSNNDDVSDASRETPEQETISEDEVVFEKGDGTSLINDGAVLLPEKLTIQFVESTHDTWRNILAENPSKLILNAEEMLDADAAGVQLLYAFVKQLRTQGCDVQISNASAHIQKVFSFAGLKGFFEGEPDVG